jgi:GGDEF domain-containing protein
MILVDLSSVDAHVESALHTLRRVSNGSRIILLTDMADEIRARRLVRSVDRPANVADDYFIRPLDPRDLLGIGADATPPSDDARLAELQRLATEDDLTGLKNRRYLREFMRQIIERARREEMQVTVLLFDIDDFKHYNDTYGHAVGDNVLREAAMLMLRCCREHDVVARIGGDEFAVVFWDRPDIGPEHAPERRTAGAHPRDAYFMAERFRSEIRNSELSFLGPEGKGSLTISGGLASFPHDADSDDQLLLAADRALLEAKRSGKDRIAIVGGD